MICMTLQKRVDCYHSTLPYPRSLMVGGDGRIVGTWIMGQNYRTQGYYGGYPAGYLRRVRALFPDISGGEQLHIFSGKVVDEGVDTVDLDATLNPTYVDDCQTLKGVPLSKYRLILADPPYSVEDAEHYQPGMVKRNKVMAALGRQATPGTFVVWLDQVLPMYRKAEWAIRGVIGMVKSTNHRFRVVTIFERT